MTRSPSDHGTDLLAAAVADAGLDPSRLGGDAVAYAAAYVARLGLSGRRVLDAGCGLGLWSLGLARQFDEVVAIDVDPDRAAASRTLADRHGLGRVHVAVGDVTGTDLPEGSFDVVFCRRVLEHVDPPAALLVVSRLLVPGGRLFLVTEGIGPSLAGYWGMVPTPPEASRAALDRLIGHCLRLVRTMPDAFMRRHAMSLLVAEFYGVARGELRGDILMKLGRRRRLREAAVRLLDRAGVTERLEDALARLIGGPRIDTLTEMFRGEDCPEFVNLSSPFVPADEVADLAGRQFRRARTVAAAIAKTADQERLLHLVDAIRTALVDEFPDAKDEDQASDPEPQPPAAVGAQPLCLDPEEIDRLLSAVDLRPVARSYEGWLVIDRGAIAVAPPPRSEFGVHELLAVVDRVTIDVWPTPAHFRANAAMAGVRFGTMHPERVVANLPLPGDDHLFMTNQVLGLAARFRGQPVLERTVRQVVDGSATQQEAFDRLYRFVQDVLFHHPTFQLVDKGGNIVQDPVALLLAGIGRCGHVASVVTRMFEILGHETRLVQLHKHVAAEVRFGGDWRLVDCDAFKAGCRPLSRDGRWVGLDELRADPSRVDAVPAIGLQLSPDGPWARTVLGTPVRGYTDVGLAWHRPYISYLYFGGVRRMPAAPPLPAVRRDGRRLSLRFGWTDPDLVRVEVLIGSTPAGWSYRDPPGPSYLAPRAADLVKLTVGAAVLADGVDVDLPGRAADGPVFLSTRAVDAWRDEHPHVHAWPSDEIVA